MGYNFTQMLLDKNARQAALDQYGQERKDKQRKEYMDNLGQVFNSIGSIGESLQQDKLANAMMNQQTPPRAQAVNPSAPGIAEANQQFGGPTQPFTGGMAGLKLNLALDANRRANLYNQLAQERLDQRQVADANASSRVVAQKDRDLMNLSNSYFKNLGVSQKALSKAITEGDQNAYMMAAQNIQANYHGAKTKLPSIPEPIIPDFQAEQPETTTGGIFGIGATHTPARAAIKAPAYNGPMVTPTSGGRTPSQKSIDALKADPSLQALFDQTYGAGAAAQYLQ